MGMPTVAYRMGLLLLLLSVWLFGWGIFFFFFFGGGDWEGAYIEMKIDYKGWNRIHIISVGEMRFLRRGTSRLWWLSYTFTRYRAVWKKQILIIFAIIFTELRTCPTVSTRRVLIILLVGVIGCTLALPTHQRHRHRHRHDHQGHHWSHPCIPTWNTEESNSLPTVPWNGGVSEGSFGSDYDHSLFISLEDQRREMHAVVTFLKDHFVSNVVLDFCICNTSMLKPLLLLCLTSLTNMSLKKPVASQRFNVVLQWLTGRPTWRKHHWAGEWAQEVRLLPYGVLPSWAAAQHAGQPAQVVQHYRSPGAIHRANHRRRGPLPHWQSAPQAVRSATDSSPHPLRHLQPPCQLRPWWALWQTLCSEYWGGPSSHDCQQWTGTEHQDLCGSKGYGRRTARTGTVL